MASAAAPAELKPAAALDQYEVLNVLGKGSFGTVSRIRRKADGRIMVWKELDYGKMREKEKQLVVSEVNILRELRHPFIVRYYDRIIDKAATTIYIVMEFCEGGDLGGLIKKCKREGTSVDEEFVWRVFTQSVIALRECHRHRDSASGAAARIAPILHRDIKPGNILLDAAQNVKLGDFGLAKELASESKFAYTSLGTPYYMSPEMISESRYNEKSDIWALGCLLYELCALSPPFDATNHLTLAVKINAGKFARIPARYSEDLYRAIRWMLNIDQSKRPTVEELDRLPRPKAVTRETALALREYQVSSSLSAKQREVKAREEELEKREAALAAADARMREREAALTARIAELTRREASLALREDEVRRHSLGDRPMLSLAAAQQQQQQVQASAAAQRAPLHRAFSAGDAVAAGPGGMQQQAGGAGALPGSLGMDAIRRNRSLSGPSAAAALASAAAAAADLEAGGGGACTPMLDCLMSGGGGGGGASSRPGTPQYSGLTVSAAGGSAAAPPAAASAPLSTRGRSSADGAAFPLGPAAAGDPPALRPASASSGAGAAMAKPMPLVAGSGGGSGLQNVPMSVDPSPASASATGGPMAPPALAAGGGGGFGGLARPQSATAGGIGGAPRLGAPPRF